MPVFGMDSKTMRYGVLLFVLMILHHETESANISSVEDNVNTLTNETINDADQASENQTLETVETNRDDSIGSTISTDNVTINEEAVESTSKANTTNTVKISILEQNSSPALLGCTLTIDDVAYERIVLYKDTSSSDIGVVTLLVQRESPGGSIYRVRREYDKVIIIKEGSTVRVSLKDISVDHSGKVIIIGERTADEHIIQEKITITEKDTVTIYSGDSAGSGHVIMKGEISVSESRVAIIGRSYDQIIIAKEGKDVGEENVVIQGLVIYDGDADFDEFVITDESSTSVFSEASIIIGDGGSLILTKAIISGSGVTAVEKIYDRIIITKQSTVSSIIGISKSSRKIVILAETSSSEDSIIRVGKAYDRVTIMKKSCTTGSNYKARITGETDLSNGFISYDRFIVAGDSSTPTVNIGSILVKKEIKTIESGANMIKGENASAFAKGLHLNNAQNVKQDSLQTNEAGKGSEVKSGSKGAEGGVKNAEGEGKEVDGEGKEVDGEGKEVDSEGKEVDGGGKEVDGEGKEVDGKGKEVDGKGKKIDGKGKVGGEGRDVVGDGKEVDGEGKEVGGKGKNVEGEGEEVGVEGKNVDGEGKEAGGEGKDVEGEGKDVEGEGKEVDGEGKEVGGGSKDVNGSSKALEGDSPEFGGRSNDGDADVDGEAKEVESVSKSVNDTDTDAESKDINDREENLERTSKNAHVDNEGKDIDFDFDNEGRDIDGWETDIDSKSDMETVQVFSTRSATEIDFEDSWEEGIPPVYHQNTGPHVHHVSTMPWWQHPYYGWMHHRPIAIPYDDDDYNDFADYSWFWDD